MALEVDIQKKLGNFSLNVSLQAENNVLALLGASGCGKSMTLKCIAGIEKPDSGRIVLDGTVLFDSEKHINLPPQKRRVGYLFQQYALFPNMTARQNIGAGVREPKERRRLVEEALVSMHLEEAGDKKPGQLSGGQQQRTALARILVNSPDVLLLDEPFSALDSHLRFQLEQEVRSAIHRFGKTVVLVSHNRDEVFRLSDTIAVMNGGHIEAMDSRDGLFQNPRTRMAAILTGCKNISALEKLDEHTLRAKDWNVKLTTSDAVSDAKYVGIRMHDLTTDGCENRFDASVEQVIENPFSVTRMLRLSENGASVGWETDKGKTTGERVSICLPPERLLLLKE